MTVEVKRPGKQNRGGGPKTKYREDYVREARNYCEQGATDMEVARYLGINKDTLYAWQARYPEFAKAMVLGKEIPDRRAVASIYRRMCGYEYEAEKLFFDAKNGRVVRAKVIETVLPDVAAGIWWTKNRLGWKDRGELSGPGGGPLQTKTTLDVSGLTDEQLRVIASIKVKSE